MAITEEMRLAALACKHILTKLQTLSDQPATELRTEGNYRHGTTSNGLRTRDAHALAAKGNRFSTSTLPLGVGEVWSAADELDLSLYHYYLPRMKQSIAAEDLTRTECLLRDAQEDYLEHVGQRNELHFASDNEAVTYLLRELKGVSADRAAIKLKVRTQSLRSAKRWVREQRRKHGQDPETGRIRPTDERTARIHALSDEGKKQREIATLLGISQGRVSQILAGH